MAIAGPNSVGTEASDRDGSSQGNSVDGWSNLGNADSSNDTYTTCVTAPVDVGGSTYTQYLKCTNFGFAIPSGAIINGIEVNVEVKRSGETAVWDECRIVKGGAISATNRSDGSSVGTSDATKSFGGATDKWGESWLHSDINGSTFGVAIAFENTGDPFNQITMSVDHVTISIYYTEVGSGANGVAMLAGTNISGRTSRDRRLFGSSTLVAEVSVIGGRNATTALHPWGEEQVLKQIFGLADWDPPHGWVTVCQGQPHAGDTGLTLSEPDATDGSFARQETTDATWSVDAAGDVRNLQAITFPAAAADWPEMDHLVVLDQPFGGNIIQYRALPTPVNITTGQSCSIPADSTVRFGFSAGAGVSNLWRSMINRYIFTGGSLGEFGNLSIAITDATPVPSKRGISLKEPVGRGYHRKVLGLGSGVWEYVNNEIRNVTSIAFPSPTTSWGVITHFVATTVPLAGDVGLWNILDTPVTANSAVSFDAGEIHFRLR